MEGAIDYGLGATTAAEENILGAAEAARRAAGQGTGALRDIGGQIPGMVGGAQQGMLGAAAGAQDLAARAGMGVRSYMPGLGQQLGAATAGGLSAQQQAAQQAQQAIQAARGTVGTAAQDLASAGQFGRGAAEAGIASLRGTGGEFDPGRIEGFMSPFEEQAVQQALADIRREGQIAQQNVGSTGRRCRSLWWFSSGSGRARTTT